MIADRPAFHVTPPTGWLNDPNGLVQWRGRHHVFHQFDPQSHWFGRMQWGHVSGDDLVHWTTHPAALHPGDGADRDGVWSGCLVDDAGTATAVYTGVVTRPDGGKAQSVMLATSTAPDLVEWTPAPDNPMAIEPPPFEVEAFRDPFLWREGDGWAMLLGSELPDGGGGAALLYRSADLRDWRFDGVFASVDDLPAVAPWTGAVWECPNLAVFDSGEAVLLVSAHDPSTKSLHYTAAIIGHVDGGRLRVESVQRFDHGHDCYAVALQRADDGRWLAYGWSWDGLSPALRESLDRTGALTFPRELTVVDGGLRLRPARELDAAATLVHESGPVVIVPGDPLELSVPRTARVSASFALDRASQLRIALRCSPSSGEQLIVDYSAARGTVVVDRGHASSLDGVYGGFSTAPFPLPPDGRIEFTAIVDHSIVELFFGDRVVFTERVYPQAADADLLRVEAGAGVFSELPSAVRLESLSVARID